MIGCAGLKQSLGSPSHPAETSKGRTRADVSGNLRASRGRYGLDGDRRRQEADWNRDKIGKPRRNQDETRTEFWESGKKTDCKRADCKSPVRSRPACRPVSCPAPSRVPRPVPSRVPRPVPSRPVSCPVPCPASCPVPSHSTTRRVNI